MMVPALGFRVFFLSNYIFECGNTYNSSVLILSQYVMVRQVEETRTWWYAASGQKNMIWKKIWSDKLCHASLLNDSVKVGNIFGAWFLSWADHLRLEDFYYLKWWKWSELPLSVPATLSATSSGDVELTADSFSSDDGSIIISGHQWQHGARGGLEEGPKSRGPTKSGSSQGQ